MYGLVRGVPFYGDKSYDFGTAKRKPKRFGLGVLAFSIVATHNTVYLGEDIVVQRAFFPSTTKPHDLSSGRKDTCAASSHSYTYYPYTCPAQRRRSWMQLLWQIEYAVPIPEFIDVRVALCYAAEPI